MSYTVDYPANKLSDAIRLDVHLLLYCNDTWVEVCKIIVSVL